MSVGASWTTETVLAAFDDHLRRARGVCEGTRVNYARFVRAFLEERFPDGRVEVSDLHARDVATFIGGVAGRYQPRTVELVATSLRSFLRFLRGQGLGGEGLEDAVPMVPHRRRGLVRHLDPASFDQLIASLDTSSARGLRDRAIILCMARLGLRVSEVCRLRLDDIDWRQGLTRVGTRKTGHGAQLPLTAEVGAALADYLQHGRPDTPAREVFVLLRQRRGAPISDSIVGRAVDRALRRAGIEAPWRGGNLLRHSLATGLLARGVSLGEIAGLLGHSRLATTRIYAAVDIEALRQVALPWPGVTP
jgi:integrase/recombinase XerD